VAENKTDGSHDEHTESMGFRYAAQAMPTASTPVDDAPGSASDTCGSDISVHASSAVPLQLANPELHVDAPTVLVPSASKATAAARAHILASQASHVTNRRGTKLDQTTRARTLAGQEPQIYTETEVASGSSRMEEREEENDRPVSSAWVNDVAPPLYTERPT
jgi:hypothetical protein